jgi:hypothetical protein
VWFDDALGLCVRVCVRVLVRVSVSVLRPHSQQSTRRGVAHDFDKPTEKAPEENVSEGDGYDIDALKLHLKVCCQLSLWMDA